VPIAATVNQPAPSLPTVRDYNPVVCEDDYEPWGQPGAPGRHRGSSRSRPRSLGARRGCRVGPADALRWSV